jgi:hypothetical protein
MHSDLSHRVEAKSASFDRHAKHIAASTLSFSVERERENPPVSYVALTMKKIRHR